MMHKTLVSVLLALGLAATASGCSKYATYCEDWSACEGGNDYDVDACIESHIGSEDVASAYDCSTEYDAYWECHESNAHCDNNNYTSGSNCGAKADSLHQCEEDASGHKAATSSGGTGCTCTCECPNVGGLDTYCEGNGCCGGTCTALCGGTVSAESCG